MDFTITDRALQKILETATDEGVDVQQVALRVAVVPGGCSGLTYDLGWDSSVGETDAVMAHGEIRVAVDRRSQPYLEGTALDFTDGLEGRGFHFHNPQAARTCACGESFGL